VNPFNLNQSPVANADLEWHFYVLMIRYAVTAIANAGFQKLQKHAKT